MHLISLKPPPNLWSITFNPQRALLNKKFKRKVRQGPLRKSLEVDENAETVHKLNEY
jgi:hypothetical protein